MRTYRPAAIIAIVLVLAAAATLLRLWVPLVLATWVAALVRPAFERVPRFRFGARWAAGLVTTTLVAALLLPIVAVSISLVLQALDLIHKLSQSQSPIAALKSMFGGSSEWAGLSWLRIGPEQARQWIAQHGLGAFSTLSKLAGAATNAAIGMIVFVSGIYVFLVRGRDIYSWFLDRSILPRAHLERLAAAYLETGRGLLVGIGLTALLQGTIAGIGFLAIGIPQAPVLGAISALAAFVPAVGAAIVWMPLAVGFGIAGRIKTAVLVLVIGAMVSTVDNFVRPALSRLGKLHLSTFTLFIAMLGGIGIFGPSGLLLGPLLVRLAAEALDIYGQPDSDEEAGPRDRNGSTSS